MPPSWRTMGGNEKAKTVGRQPAATAYVEMTAFGGRGSGPTNQLIPASVGKLEGSFTEENSVTRGLVSTTGVPVHREQQCETTEVLSDGQHWASQILIELHAGIDSAAMLQACTNCG